MRRLLGIRSPILDHLPRTLGPVLVVLLAALLASAASASPQSSEPPRPGDTFSGTVQVTAVDLHHHRLLPLTDERSTD